MDGRKYIVKGGRPLKGEISVKGAKNAVLPAVSATPSCPRSL
jgi:UDP-N-acetylglucosamine 1-carboxyvinyltransferase